MTNLVDYLHETLKINAKSKLKKTNIQKLTEEIIQDFFSPDVDWDDKDSFDPDDDTKEQLDDLLENFFKDAKKLEFYASEYGLDYWSQEYFNKYELNLIEDYDTVKYLESLGSNCDWCVKDLFSVAVEDNFLYLSSDTNSYYMGDGYFDLMIKKFT